MYHSNITLILVEQLEPINENVYFRKLDVLFDAMVILYGLEDLVNISNIEKFKKEIKVQFSSSNPKKKFKLKFFFYNSKKVVFPLIDAILFNYENFDLFGGYLTNCIDLILVNDLASFQV